MRPFPLADAEREVPEATGWLHGWQVAEPDSTQVMSEARWPPGLSVPPLMSSHHDVNL